MSCVRQNMKIILKGLQMDVSNNLSMRILIISPLWALFESSFLIMSLISSIGKSTYESDLFVIKGKSDSNILSFSINEHCLAKKKFKISFFSLKPAMNLLLWKSGWIQRILFKRAFNRAFRTSGRIRKFFEIFR